MHQHPLSFTIYSGEIKVTDSLQINCIRIDFKQNKLLKKETLSYPLPAMGKEVQTLNLREAVTNIIKCIYMEFNLMYWIFCFFYF